MNAKILLFGLVLLIPGVLAADFALMQGPGSWAISQEFFWGTPVANFVFWIGLAHAGTLFSAILPTLGCKWQRRIALVAEEATVAALLVAGFFPVMHLGRPLHFYEMIPVGNIRDSFVNPESPLVWDFTAILSYASLSSLFLFLHLLKPKFPTLEKFRKPLAWILFFLVLWVHTIVSLDFSVTFVPKWSGGYFSLYFIFGALYSGAALVQILVELWGHRVRRLEECLLSLSWAMLAFWGWDFFSKGAVSSELLLFGFLLPQLLWISPVRECSWCRMLLAASVLAALWWERLSLVMPDFSRWTWIDSGLSLLGVGVFCTGFGALRLFVERFLPEVGDEFVQNPENQAQAEFARRPFCVAVSVGIFTAGIFAAYFVYKAPDVFFVRIVPALFPLSALAAGFVLLVFILYEILGKVRTILLSVSLVLVLIACGIFTYRGTDTSYSEPFRIVQDGETFGAYSDEEASMLWNARCSACHGTDGKFNRKFVHEFYPLPQTLSTERLDSLGVDSLVQVVLNGRGYMRAFGGRISEDEAHLLVLHLRNLAKIAEETP